MNLERELRLRKKMQMDRGAFLMFVKRSMAARKLKWHPHTPEVERELRLRGYYLGHVPNPEDEKYPIDKWDSLE